MPAAGTPSSPTHASAALTTTLDALPHVTPRRAKLLAELGLHRLIDLLEHFPRRYQFEAAEGAVRDLVPGQVHTVRGEVIACDYVIGRGKPRFEATLSDEHGDRLGVVWFNGHFWRRKINPGQQLRVRGTVRTFRGIPQMANPSTQRIGEGEDVERIEESKLRPVYAASAGLKSNEIEQIVAEQLPGALPAFEEYWPEDLRRERGLIGRAEAYRLMHQPPTFREAAQARRRLVFDELMLMQLGLGLSRRLGPGGRATAPVLPVDRTLDTRIRARFPFDLTAAQTRAVHDMLRDLRSGRPMNRLLQGDVGSGKTSVAVYGMLVAVANRMQAALLAPTEVLAEQHFLTLSTLLRGSRVEVGLFTQRTRRQSRGKLFKQLAGGVVHVAVGTQALLQEDVEFANLGLVVVDEQHKLGVRQRATLKTKGHAPHSLVMTATPIPRTLALSFFADFDLSVIDELPPGRTPIKTSFFRTEQSTPAFEFVRRQVAEGRQAYVVLPQIDESPADDVKSVKAEFERLGKGPLTGLRLAMLHGEMGTDEKREAMDAFRAGSADVLVATTVIEVGVDVPNATVMLIESAERFGLAQLHQLRGRVGRGGHESYCILVSDARGDDALQRLQAMCRTTDGFEIAELDLQLRGPGEFFGTRQSGLPELKVADVSRELELLKLCRDDAATMLEADPHLSAPQHRAVHRALRQRFGDALPLAAIG